jgi:hypothetical protein
MDVQVKHLVILFGNNPKAIGWNKHGKVVSSGGNIAKSFQHS